MNTTWTIGRVVRALWLAAWQGSVGFACGMLVYQHFRPTARIYTNVNEHTPLNHGQQFIDVTLPDGMSFASFGGCGPRWQKKTGSYPIVWTSISCSVEKWDSEAKEYRQAPYNGNAWLEITP